MFRERNDVMIDVVVHAPVTAKASVGLVSNQVILICFKHWKTQYKDA